MIKQLIETGQLKRTIRFYGTPAEEKYFGIVFMARAGAFNDRDVCLDWHPGATNQANTQTSRALVDFEVDFYGKTAHAALDPWNGKSAVDALEIFTTGINYLREHIKPSMRMHYQILHAGDAANIVPDHAKLWLKSRGRETTIDRVMAAHARTRPPLEALALHAERAKHAVEANDATLAFAASLEAGRDAVVPGAPSVFREALAAVGFVELADAVLTARALATPAQAAAEAWADRARARRDRRAPAALVLDALAEALDANPEREDLVSDGAPRGRVRCVRTA